MLDSENAKKLLEESTSFIESIYDRSGKYAGASLLQLRTFIFGITGLAFGYAICYFLSLYFPVPWYFQALLISISSVLFMSVPAFITKGGNSRLQYDLIIDDINQEVSHQMKMYKYYTEIEDEVGKKDCLNRIKLLETRRSEIVMLKSGLSEKEATNRSNQTVSNEPLSLPPPKEDLLDGLTNDDVLILKELIKEKHNRS